MDYLTFMANKLTPAARSLLATVAGNTSPRGHFVGAEDTFEDVTLGDAYTALIEAKLVNRDIHNGEDEADQGAFLTLTDRGTRSVAMARAAGLI